MVLPGHVAGDIEGAECMPPENYEVRRQRLHDCRSFRVPSTILCAKIETDVSALGQLPQEVLLVIRDFLSFKSKCCLLMTNKFWANIIAERTQANQLHITNDQRKEIKVRSPHSPTLVQMASVPLISTHVCGEYKDVFRVLARDWNSASIKACQRCCAFRPLNQDYWGERAQECGWYDAPVSGMKVPRRGHTDQTYKSKIESWCEGYSDRCPDCKPDHRIAGNELDFQIRAQ